MEKDVSFIIVNSLKQAWHGLLVSAELICTLLAF